MKSNMKFVLATITLLFGFLSFAAAPPPGFPVVKGVVKSINLETAQITVKAEAIPNLNMPPMTMPYTVQNPQNLRSLFANDRILFVADKVNGKYVITWIEKEPAKVTFRF